MSIEYIAFFGIVLLLIGFTLYFYDQHKKTHYLVDGFLYLSWIVAAVFAYYLFDLLSLDHSEALKNIKTFSDYVQYIEIQKNSVTAQSLAPLGMMIAALIASASVMKNIAETKANEAEKHKKEASKFHLDKCTEGLEHFYDLLKDGNNNRVKWIAAARALLTIFDLSKGITEPHHQQFFDLEKSKYRQKLYELYTKKEITPLFFTGIKDWNRSDISVSDIIDSARSGDGYGYTYDDVDNFIDENSIVAIFSILDYPDDYLDYDPLSNPADRYKEALKPSWTFTEPKKSANEFMQSTMNILKQKEQK